MIGFQCIGCKYYLWDLTCKAFPSPDYIPREIVTDEFDHDIIIPGQVGDYVCTTDGMEADEE